MTNFAALLVAVSLAIAPARALWPLPQSLQTGSTALKLSSSFDISLSLDNAPQDLVDAVARTKSSLQTDQLGRLIVGRGASDASAVASADELSTLTLQFTGTAADAIAAEAVKALDDRDEAYELSVPSDGSGATISANSTLGLLRGLTTFEQLWYTYENTTYTVEAPIEIQDAPTYVRPCAPPDTDSQLTPSSPYPAVPRPHARYSAQLVRSPGTWSALTCNSLLPASP
jgi:hexosaminidase